MKYYFNNTSNAFNDFFGSLLDTNPGFPPMNIFEEENGYVIEANIAGYEEDEVKLSVEKHVLTLKAERAEKEDDRNYTLKEIKLPSFERAFTLPEDADESAITAERKNGILKVVISKKEEYLKGKVEIEIK